MNNLLPELSLAITQATVCFACTALTRRKQTPSPKKKSPLKARKCRDRNRRTITEIYNGLGPTYFRRAYRMTIDTFWQLHATLQEAIKTQASALKKLQNEKRAKEREATKLSEGGPLG